MPLVGCEGAAFGLAMNRRSLFQMRTCWQRNWLMGCATEAAVAVRAVISLEGRQEQHPHLIAADH